MFLFEQRIDSLAKMFTQTLQQLQLSRTLAEMNTPDLITYRTEYIGEIIKTSLYNQKEKYIERLLEQLQELRNNNGEDRVAQIQMEHQKQMEKMKRECEERQGVPTVVDNEVRSLIQAKMQELEKDYVLRVIHQQEMKGLKRSLEQEYKDELEKALSQQREESERQHVGLDRINALKDIQLDTPLHTPHQTFQDINLETGCNDRSPMRELDEMYSALQRPTQQSHPPSLPSLPQSPIQHPSQQPPSRDTLRRSKSIESFNALKDNFQRELCQLRQTLKVKQSKIVKTRQHLMASRPCSSMQLHLDSLRLNSNRVGVPGIVPNLDSYTFGKYQVQSPCIRKTTRGSQRVLNAKRVPNQPESPSNQGSYKYLRQQF